jgi:hypothetical protein
VGTLSMWFRRWPRRCRRCDRQMLVFVGGGVLTSCLPWETTRDGVFGQRLLELIANGPVGVGPEVWPATPAPRCHTSGNTQPRRAAP